MAHKQSLNALSQIKEKFSARKDSQDFASIDAEKPILFSNYTSGKPDQLATGDQQKTYNL